MYDELNRVASETDVWGTILTLSYDKANNLTLVTDSLSGITSYSYDATNALVTLLYSQGTVTLRQDRQYDGRGLLGTVTRYSDLAGSTKVGDSLYGYDNVGRQSHITHRDGTGTTLAELTYTYDAAGKVSSEVWNGASSGVGYDATNQVTGFGAEAYGFDASGNRNTSGYVVGTGNRVSTDGTWTYTYDVAGQRTKKSKGAALETWEYGYDTRGQMTWAEKRATDGGTLQLRETYRYDASGNRVETSSYDGVTTVTYRSVFGPGNEAWADTTTGGALNDRYVSVRGEELPGARISGTNVVAWLHADRLGSLRLVTDSAGAARDVIAYTAFGKITSETDASWGGRLKWTGQPTQGATGLQQNHWRWYDLETGTWTTLDPKWLDAGDYNLSRYVGNNSQNLTDPLGLFGEELTAEQLSRIQPETEEAKVKLSELSAYVGKRDRTRARLADLRAQRVKAQVEWNLTQSQLVMARLTRERAGRRTPQLGNDILEIRIKRLEEQLESREDTLRAVLTQLATAEREHAEAVNVLADSAVRKKIQENLAPRGVLMADGSVRWQTAKIAGLPRWLDIAITVVP